MKLREVCEITSGQNAPQASSDYQIGGKTFIKVSDLDNVIFDDNESRSCKVTDNAIKEYKLKLFPAGSIIFAKSGLSCVKNRVYLLKRPSYIVNHLCILYNFKIQINHLWLLYYLKAFNVTKLIKDFSYPSIKLSEIGEIDIPAIPLEKQNKIVEEITQLSNLCKNKLSELNSFDELIKSRFIEMFGNPIDESRVNCIFTKMCVFNPKKSEVREMMNIECSFVPMECVGVDGSFSIKENGPISKYYKGYTYFRNNDVLLAKITPCFENGKSAIAEGCKNGIGFGTTEFHVCRCIEGISNPIWLKHLLKNDALHFYATTKMTGSAGQKRIQTPFFESLKIYVPDIESQNKFAEFVKLIDKSKFVVQQQIKDLKELLDKKMDEYFGG